MNEIENQILSISKDIEYYLCLADEYLRYADIATDENEAHSYMCEYASCKQRVDMLSNDIRCLMKEMDSNTADYSSVELNYPKRNVVHPENRVA